VDRFIPRVRLHHPHSPPRLDQERSILRVYLGDGLDCDNLRVRPNPGAPHVLQSPILAHARPQDRRLRNDKLRDQQADLDGWSYLIRPKLDWLVYLFLFFMWLCLVIEHSLLPACLEQLAEEEIQRRKRDAQERQRDIESGIARGIEEWKASAKGDITPSSPPYMYTDEKSKLH
jgi:hypothetical protein